MKCFNRNTILLIFITVFYTGTLFAQEGIFKGVVVDDNGKLAGVVVKLLRERDSTQVGVTSTDIDGEFEIKAPLNKLLFVKLEYIGYATTYSKAFQLDLNDTKMELGKIRMEMETQELDIVNLVAEKKSISFSEGKTKVHVANSSIAKGSSAFALMDQLPGVSLNHDGNISLNGKPGVLILINGRETHMSGEDLISYLESLPGDTIEDFVIDRNPSASSDAEGSGVIDIQLRKGSENGFTGNISAGYTYKQMHLWNSNVFLSNQGEKLQWSFIADFSKKGRLRDQTLSREYAEGTLMNSMVQNGDEKMIQKPLHTQLDVNYDINEKHNVGAYAQWGNKKSDWIWNSHSQVKYNDVADVEYIDSENQHNETFKHNLIHAYYNTNLDSLGSTFHISADVLHAKRKVHSDFYNQYLQGDSESNNHLQSPSQTSYQALSAKADYKKKWENGTELLIGTKISKVNFDSELNFYIIQDEPIWDIENSSDFRYDESVLAGYASYRMPLHSKWDLEAGLRVEKTWGVGEEKLMDDENKKHYLDWFPNLKINQKVSDSYAIEYAFSRRIQRPVFDLLNPTIFYIDPYSVARGNPYLKSQYSNEVSMTHIIRNRYSIALGYTRNKDFMAEAPLLDTETNQTIFTTENFKKYESYDMNIFAPLRIAYFWNTDNSFTASYQRFKLDFEDTPDRINKDVFVLFKSQHNISLPWDIKLNVNFTAQSPLVFGYYKLSSQWFTDIGFQKSFNNDKWNVSMKMMDVFKSRSLDVAYEFNNSVNKINQYMGNQAVSLQVRYNFGIGNKEGQKSSYDMEEFDRID